MNQSDDEQVLFATGGYDHTIKFWQVYTGVCSVSVPHGETQINALEITPDRKLLAAASYQHVKMYDLNTSVPSKSYESIPKNVTSVGFHEDTRWMYTGGEDGIIRIWDLRSHHTQTQRQYNVRQPVNSVCLHPNQVDLYIGDQSGALNVWDVRSQQSEPKTAPFFKIPEMEVSIQYCHINPEGTYISAVDNHGYCYLFSIQNIGEICQPLRQTKIHAHKRAALKCKFSPDSTLLVTTSADTTAKVWRTSDIQLLLSQKKDENPTSLLERSWTSIEVSPIVELKNSNQRWVWDVAFSADSQYILTASSDNAARLWSVATGEMRREYNGHQKAVTALAFRDAYI